MAKSTPAPEVSTMRVPQQSIVLHRDGKQIVPAIGIPFEFTATELADIEAVNPDAVTAMAVVDLSAQAPSGDL